MIVSYSGLKRRVGGASPWTEERKLELLKLYSGGCSVGEAARKMGSNRGRVRSILRSMNVSVRPQTIAQRGRWNPSWKGGVILRRGYRFIHKPEHPGANHGGYVAEHRLVMEAKIGRLLDRREVVHHIDSNPLNNAPENLMLFSTNAEHLRYELKGRVPNWSAAGKARMGHSIRRSRFSVR